MKLLFLMVSTEVPNDSVPFISAKQIQICQIQTCSA